MNNQKIAETIYNVIHADWKTRKEWLKEGKKSWKICKNYSIERSEDCLCWYVYRQSGEFGEYLYYKVVPDSWHVSKRDFTEMLKVQPWNPAF